MIDIFAQVRRFEAVGFTREQSECLVEVFDTLEVRNGLQPARKDEKVERVASRSELKIEIATLKAELTKAFCIQGAAVVISIAVLIKLLP